MLFTISVNISAQSLDTTFGTNGTVTHNGIGNYFNATELPDGNVILSGDYETQSISQAVITKLKPDGSVDTSFGTGGKYVIDQYSDSDYYEAFSPAIVQPDGKLVVLYAAEYDNGIDEETVSIKLIRLNANGTLDNNFSGYSAQNLLADNYPYGIFRLQSGKILMYGENYIMRFNENGTLDTSYANNGVRTISFEIGELQIMGTSLYLHDYWGKRLVKLENETTTNTSIYNLPQNSSFYITNTHVYIHDTTNSFSQIIKLDANLNPVNSFGVNGVANFNTYVGNEFVFQPQGSILAQKYSAEYDNNNNIVSYNKEFMRINTDGSLDSTFGNSGIYSINIPENSPYAYHSDDYIHSNGKLYHLFYNKDWTINSIYIQRSSLPNEILAVSNYDSKKAVRIVQNPVGENLELSDKITNAKIYDISGKATGITFDGKQTSVESLKAGVYLINATSESGSKINLKFIKK